MKYNIHGFYQPKAVELGLTNDDLLVLRWFVDFAGTDKMKKIIEDDGIYYWVNYVTVLNDLPVLRISKTTLKRKHFDKLCEAHILRHKHIKKDGSFSYYAYGINYDTLIYLQDSTPSTKLDYPSTKLDEGCDKTGLPPSTKLDYPYDEIVPTKINLLNNPSTINNIITPSKKESKKTYGEYKRIKLTDKEYQKLCEDYGKEKLDGQIKLLDEYVESNNNKNKYTNFNLVIRKSFRENWFKKDNKSTGINYEIF